MSRHKLILSGSIIAIFVTVLALLCTLPVDPKDPSNTKVNIVLRTTDKTDTNFLEDTAGNRIRIGAALNLPENIESVGLKIIFGGTVVFDTTYTNLPANTSDTLWKDIVFYSEGSRTVTLTPTSTLGLPPVSATIKIIGKEFPANHPPTINILGTTVIKPSETCSLAIKTDDVDADQILNVFITGNPNGSQLQKNNTQFIWTPSSGFIGNDTVVFTVIDNGQPPLSTDSTVIITVTATPHPPTIEVNGNQTLVPLQTCSLLVKMSDEDQEQVLKLTVTGEPDGSKLVNDSMFVWTVPADFVGEKVVTFTATDNGIPPLSTSTKTIFTVSAATVNKAPKWDAKTLPVPLKDTVKYTKKLTDICHDSDDDAISFTLSPGMPAGDTIIGATYTFTAKPALIGSYKVKIIASDPKGAADTMIVDLTVTSSTAVDVTPPMITLVAPSKDSAVVATPTYLIDVIASDVSGITSVTARFGATILPMQPTSGHYTATMGGLKAGEYNKIEVLATDASPAANKLIQTVYIKYSPGLTIKYDGNSNTGGAVPVDTGSYQAGAKVTVMANTSNLVKTGSTFVEWNTSKDGTGIRYAPGATFTMGNVSDTLFAKWSSKVTFALTIAATNGSVTKAPDLAAYDSGTVVTLTPVPAAKYHFSSWGGALTGSVSPGTITMNGAKMVTAAFEVNLANSFTLTVLSTNGAVKKSPDLPQYDSGSSVGLKATASAGYGFANWSGDATGTSDSITVIMSSAKNITANFTLSTYQLTVAAAPASSGTITAPTTPSATVSHGVATTITAVAGTGYVFDKWVVTAGTATVAAPASATSTVTLSSGNATITANFVLIPYVLTAVVAPASSGTVTAPATANHAVATAISATPGSAYNFGGWSVTTGTAVFGDAGAASTTVTLSSGNATISANFVPKTNQLTVEADANGTITAPTAPFPKNVNIGAQTPITASANTGFKFNGWTITSTPASNAIIADAALATTTVTLTGNATVRANFVPITYTLTMTNDGHGTTTPASSSLGSYNVPITISATPATGYSFNNWTATVGGTNTTFGSATTASTTVTLTGDATIRANFTANPVTLTVTNDGHGTTTPATSTSGSYNVPITISATPATGYSFNNWTVTVGSTNATFGNATTASTTVTLAGNATIRANFTANPVTLIVTNNGNGTTNPSGTVSGTYNNPITIQATASARYGFSGWTVTAGAGNVTFGNASSATTTATLTGDATIRANFVQTAYRVVYNGNGQSGGSAPVDNTDYTSGSIATIKPNSGALIQGSYSFVGWENTNTADIYECGKQVTITGDLNLTARYSFDRVMDNDGNIYTSILIGTRRWLLQSLKTSKYRDGSSIYQVTNGTAWTTRTKSPTSDVCAWADFSATQSQFGRLYNSSAVQNEITPAGWRIPTQADWDNLYSQANSNTCGLITNWGAVCSGSPGGINATGFSQVESGDIYQYNNEPAYWSNSDAFMWVASPSGTYLRFNRVSGGISFSYYNIAEGANNPLGYGFVIRCVKE